jgi:hypothetical protein
MQLDSLRTPRPILDLHVHVGPELLKRRYTVSSLAAEAEREGFGFVAKNHFQPTTAWTAMLRSRCSVPVIGSVALNHGVGGIGPEGIRAALSGCKSDPGQEDPDPGRFIVWMPTIHAEAHLAYFRRQDINVLWGCSPTYPRTYPAGGGLGVLDPEDPRRLHPAAQEVLRAIAERDLVLATGHLSATETGLLVREACRTGLNRIIVTHPLFQVTAMPLDRQVELGRSPGVFVELAYVNLAIDHLPIHSYVEVIRAVGPEHVILSTDLGQVDHEPVGEGWRKFYGLLRRHGVSDEEFVQMAVVNPHWLMLGP